MHLLKNQGWNNGYVALGLPTHTNSLENKNFHGLQRYLQDELGENSEKYSMLDVARIIFGKLLRRWSNNCTHNDLNEEFAISSDVLDEARELETDPYVVQLGPDLFCCCQKTPKGRLYKITVKEVGFKNEMDPR